MPRRHPTVRFRTGGGTPASGQRSPHRRRQKESPCQGQEPGAGWPTRSGWASLLLALLCLLWQSPWGHGLLPPDAARGKRAGRRLPSSTGEPARLRGPPEASRRGVWSTDQPPRPSPPRRSLEGILRPTEPRPLDPPLPPRPRAPRVVPLEPPKDQCPRRQPHATASWPKRVRLSNRHAPGGKRSASSKVAQCFWKLPRPTCAKHRSV